VEVDHPAVDDFYVASTFGLDVSAGAKVGPAVPYLSVGVTDVSSFFLVGDDNYASSNYHPYFGPVFSIGADALINDLIRAGAEIYGAPGGHSLPDPDAHVTEGFGTYGSLYTARLRIGVEL
jgi:hypothetical protein